MLQDEVRALHTQLDAQAQMISGLVKEVDETKHDVSILSSRLIQTNVDLNNKVEEADSSYAYYIYLTAKKMMEADSHTKGDK